MQNKSKVDITMTCCCFCPENDAMNSSAAAALWFAFILKADRGVKVQLNQSFSMEIDSTGDYGTCVTICSYITRKSDTCANAFCAACCCSLVENACSTCVDPCCLLTAKTTAIFDAMKSSNTDFSVIPPKKFMVKLMMKTFLSDIYGMRNTNIKPEETTYTSSQIEEVAAGFAKLNDQMAAEKIIRILNVGTCDHQVMPNKCYNLFMSIPLMSCCYAGSYSQGRKLAAYMQDVGIEFNELNDVLTNFDDKWSKYLGEFFVRCVTDNEDEITRMTTGKIGNKSMHETLNKLRESAAPSLATPTDSNEK